MTSGFKNYDVNPIDLFNFYNNYLSTKKSFKPIKCNDGDLTIGYLPYGNWLGIPDTKIKQFSL